MNRIRPIDGSRLCYTDNSGYVALITVLVIGAVGVAITVSQLLLGTDSLRTNSTHEASGEAAILAHACAEEGLQQVRNSTPYTGSGDLSIGSGTCSYLVTSQGGSDRTIKATGTVGTITRKAEVIINTINPTIQIASWQEVSDF